MNATPNTFICESFYFSFLTSNVRRWSSSLFNETHLFPSLYKYLQFYTMLFISINERAIDLITSSSVEQWWESWGWLGSRILFIDCNGLYTHDRECKLWSEVSSRCSDMELIQHQHQKLHKNLNNLLNQKYPLWILHSNNQSTTRKIDFENLSVSVGFGVRWWIK